MLARRREQILIIAGLIGLNILLGWSLGRLWRDYRRSTQWLYASAPAQPPAPLNAGSNQARQPQSFVEIVDRNVFSPLRGTPPPQPQEEAPPPKLPVLFGTMNLGSGRFALMAAADQPSAASKRVLPGQEIGGYKLVSIGTSNVVLEWQDKKVTLDISESARSSPGNVQRTASARSVGAATPGYSAPSTGRPMAISSVAGPRPPVPQAGPPVTSPQVQPETVVGGKRRVTVSTPFGPVEQWQDGGTSGSQTPQQTGGPNN
jgi:hypothetical protein